MASGKGPVLDCIRLSNSISIYQPTAEHNNAAASQEKPAHTIILCAWFRALPKHIAKYTAAHSLRNPGAQILLIESGVSDMVLTPNSMQRTHLRPAVEVLKVTRAEGRSVLLHVFSNGGTNSAVQLAHA